MRGEGEAQFLTNHRDSENMTNDYHSCMKINCHVDPVVPPRQLALVFYCDLFVVIIDQNLEN